VLRQWCSHGRADRFVGEVDPLTGQGPAQQDMVGVGVGDRHQVVRSGQANGIDLRGGGLQQGQTIFKLIGLVQRQGRFCEALHEGDVVERGCTVRLKQSEQRGRAGHQRRSDPHCMRQVEEPALKTPVVSEPVMEQGAPTGIAQVTINGRHGGVVQRAADRIALHQPAARDEHRMIVPHAVLIGRGAHQRSETERHVVAEMDGIVPCEQSLKGVRGTEVERVKESVAGGQGVHGSYGCRSKVRSDRCVLEWCAGLVVSISAGYGAQSPGIHIDDFGRVPEVFQFRFCNGLFPIGFGIFSESLDLAAVLVGRGRSLFGGLTSAPLGGVHVHWHDGGLLSVRQSPLCRVPKSMGGG
jgi:hypothetical protein